MIELMTRAAKEPVNAFSIGFDEERFDELGYAELASRTFGSRHHTYRVQAEDCLKALPDMIRAFDEPFGNSSAIPTYFCARMAAENGVNTLLAGDGGDDVCGDNKRYAVDKRLETYHTLPRILRKTLSEPMAAALPGSIS